ncbi:MAG TPA: hypothetical protein VGF70_04175 [Solirubrobacteraceae bacterium]
MADQRQSDVLGALPRTRPHRRSAKRPERPGETTGKPRAATRATSPSAPQRGNAPSASAGRPKSKPRTAAGSRSGPRAVGGSRSAASTRSKADRLRQPPQPRGIPSQPRSPVPSTPHPPEILGTFVQAAAELTEIGLSLGAQLLRRAVARLPRP